MIDMNENLNGQNDPQDADQTVNINVDDNTPGDQHLNEPVAEESELEALKAQLDAKNDQYLRLAAEFDNFKRRTAKERIELIQTAGKDVIVSLLDVLDDSERAEQQLGKTEDIAQIKEGIRLVFNKLRSTLQSRGLKAMDTKGQEFNADFHEAITEIPAGDDQKGKVVDEVMKGYTLNDKIIRFAKVVVGK
ncbi:nucleotide exchange factor GrpE [Flaviaesturariibacter terrae]